MPREFFTAEINGRYCEPASDALPKKRKNHLSALIFQKQLIKMICPGQSFIASVGALFYQSIFDDITSGE